jgi:hypothetical protein
MNDTPLPHQQQEDKGQESGVKDRKAPETIEDYADLCVDYLNAAPKCKEWVNLERFKNLASVSRHKFKQGHFPKDRYLKFLSGVYYKDPHTPGGYDDLLYIFNKYIGPLENLLPHEHCLAPSNKTQAQWDSERFHWDNLLIKARNRFH